MNKFFEFKQAENQPTELFIYGDITSDKWDGTETGAAEIANRLQEIDGDIIVRINSYGGEVKEGLGIFNALKNFSHKVTTINDGFACSAASIIFCAGSERIMNDASLLMIHNAWTMAMGDSNELRKQADDLEKITQPSIEIYKAVTGLSEDDIKAMMNSETWITAEEALSLGFATEIKELEAKQSINEMYLKNQIHKNKALEAQILELEDKIATMSDLREETKKTPWQDYFNS